MRRATREPRAAVTLVTQRPVATRSPPITANSGSGIGVMRCDRRHNASPFSCC